MNFVWNKKKNMLQQQRQLFVLAQSMAIICFTFQLMKSREKRTVKSERLLSFGKRALKIDGLFIVVQSFSWCLWRCYFASIVQFIISSFILIFIWISNFTSSSPSKCSIHAKQLTPTNFSLSQSVSQYIFSHHRRIHSPLSSFVMIHVNNCFWSSKWSLFNSVAFLYALLVFRRDKTIVILV